MRILVTMPHFFGQISADADNRSRQPARRSERLVALTTSIAKLHQTFGKSVYGLDHGAREAKQSRQAISLDLVICTTPKSHLIDELPSMADLFRHHMADIDPIMLGFECHRIMREAHGLYEYYCYLEDDIAICDPLFFRKREIFDQAFGPKELLQPNRFEIKSSGPIHKLYVDYRLNPSVTAFYQSVSSEILKLDFAGQIINFERTTYPSAGSFFLSDNQLSQWIKGPYFLDGDISYMSPLDSAATLSVMKTFHIYKPVLDQAWFLEIEHSSPRWIGGVENQVRFIPSV